MSPVYQGGHMRSASQPHQSYGSRLPPRSASSGQLYGPQYAGNSGPFLRPSWQSPGDLRTWQIWQQQQQLQQQQQQQSIRSGTPSIASSVGSSSGLSSSRSSNKLSSAAAAAAVTAFGSSPVPHRYHRTRARQSVAAGATNPSHQSQTGSHNDSPTKKRTVASTNTSDNFDHLTSRPSSSVSSASSSEATATPASSCSASDVGNHYYSTKPTGRTHSLDNVSTTPSSSSDASESSATSWGSDFDHHREKRSVVSSVSAPELATLAEPRRRRHTRSHSHLTAISSAALLDAVPEAKPDAVTLPSAQAELLPAEVPELARVEAQASPAEPAKADSAFLTSVVVPSPQASKPELESETAKPRQPKSPADEDQQRKGSVAAATVSNNGRSSTLVLPSDHRRSVAAISNSPPLVELPPVPHALPARRHVRSLSANIATITTTDEADVKRDSKSTPSSLGAPQSSALRGPPVSDALRGPALSVLPSPAVRANEPRIKSEQVSRQTPGQSARPIREPVAAVPQTRAVDVDRRTFSEPTVAAKAIRKSRSFSELGSKIRSIFSSSRSREGSRAKDDDGKSVHSIKSTATSATTATLKTKRKDNTNLRRRDSTLSIHSFRSFNFGKSPRPEDRTFEVMPSSDTAWNPAYQTHSRRGSELEKLGSDDSVLTTGEIQELRRRSLYGPVEVGSGDVDPLEPASYAPALPPTPPLPPSLAAPPLAPGRYSSRTSRELPSREPSPRKRSPAFEPAGHSPLEQSRMSSVDLSTPNPVTDRSVSPLTSSPSPSLVAIPPLSSSPKKAASLSTSSSPIREPPSMPELAVDRVPTPPLDTVSDLPPQPAVPALGNNNIEKILLVVERAASVERQGSRRSFRSVQEEEEAKVENEHLVDVTAPPSGFSSLLDALDSPTVDTSLNTFESPSPSPSSSDTALPKYVPGADHVSSTASDVAGSPALPHAYDMMPPVPALNVDKLSASSRVGQSPATPASVASSSSSIDLTAVSNSSATKLSAPPRGRRRGKPSRSVQAGRSAIKSPGAPKVASVSFSSEILVYSTYSRNVYDRRPELAACNRMSPQLAREIRDELDQLKRTMPTHPDSLKYTYFI